MRVFAAGKEQNMKKLIVVLLALCLVAGCVIGYVYYKGTLTENAQQMQAAASEPAADEPAAAEPVTEGTAVEPAADAAAEEVAAAPEETVVEADTEPGEEGTEAIPRVRSLDYAAIYATHEPDEVVAKVGEHEVTWSEYFYLLFSQSVQVQDYFNNIAGYYGIAMDWEDPLGDDSGETYLDVVKENVDSYLSQQAALEGFMAENGVELTEEDLAAIAETEKSDIATALQKEDGTREEFDAFLSELYLTPELYDRMNRINFLSQRGFKQLYGENGENVSDETASAWLAENEYMNANHILLITMNPSTGEELDEATKQEKLETAEKLLAELKGITDQEELVKRFKELKEEYCEDTGKVAYPDGYVFTPGTMVSAFEEAVKELDAYGLSDIVETEYGYHIILRLPLDADTVLETSSAGTPLTARSKAANDEYAQRLQDYLDSLNVSYAEGFTSPNLLDFVK